MSGKIVWKGAKALRRHLVPIGDLVPSEGNPRRGNVAVAAESLARFGQVRPVLTDAGCPGTIVAGHHVTLAAAELGWTHVAALAGEFADQNEARRYMLMDNRSHDRGDYDLVLLETQLREIDQDGGLAGTGYDAFDLDALSADIAEQTRLADDAPLADPPVPAPLTCPACGHRFIRPT